MSEEKVQPPLPPLPERLVSIAVELAGLALMWRALDGPDPRELARDAWDTASGWVRSQRSYRRAMMDTLARIRDLPETEAPS